MLKQFLNFTYLPNRPDRCSFSLRQQKEYLVQANSFVA